MNSEVLILVVGKVAQLAISFISVKMLVVMLSIDEVGRYYILLSITSFFTFLLLNPVGQYFNRHIAQWKQMGLLSESILMFFMYRILLSLSAIPFLWLILFSFDLLKSFEYWSLSLIVLISLLASTQFALLSFLNFLEMRIVFVLQLLATAFLGLASSLFFVSYEPVAELWLAGTVFSQLIVMFFTFRVLTDGEEVVSAPKLGGGHIPHAELLLYLIPTGFTLFLQWGQIQAFRLVLDYKYTLEIVAMVSVGMALAHALFIAVESLIMQYFQPIFFRRLKGGDKKVRADEWNEMVNVVLPFYVMLTVYLAILSPYIVRVLTSPDYHSTYLVFILASMAELIRAVTNLVYLISQSELKVASSVFPYLVGLIVYMVFLYLYGVEYGLWFVPLVLLFSNISILVMMIFRMNKLLKIDISIYRIIFALVLMLPLMVVTLIEGVNDFWTSLLILSISGMYLILMGGLMFKASRARYV